MADELYSRIPDTPISDDTARLERIRGALERLNYSYDGVRDLLGERAFEAMARDQVVPGTWRVQNILDDAHTTDPDRRLARMIGFFLFARTLTRMELADALGGEPALNDFIAANLVEPAESENTRTPKNPGEEPHYRAVFDLRRIRLMTAPSCGWPLIWGRISDPGCCAKITCWVSGRHP